MNLALNSILSLDNSIKALLYFISAEIVTPLFKVLSVGSDGLIIRGVSSVEDLETSQLNVLLSLVDIRVYLSLKQKLENLPFPFFPYTVRVSIKLLLS